MPGGWDLDQAMAGLFGSPDTGLRGRRKGDLLQAHHGRPPAAAAADALVAGKADAAVGVSAPRV